jgi:hypothetical protein
LYVVEDNFMTDGFDRVLIELDFGSKAEAGMRSANGIASMEDLLLAKSDLAFGQLDCVQRYDQLRLYFVTEWVREFGLGNRMLDFNEKDFNKYFLGKLEHLAQGTSCISPSYLETLTVPYDPVPAIVSALTSENRGFARHEDYDVDI